MVDEPFILAHGDFYGRNIPVRDDQLSAVIDLEFVGSYPLSETLRGGGVDVIGADTEELDEETTVWNRKIRSLISSGGCAEGLGRG